MLLKDGVAYELEENSRPFTELPTKDWRSLTDLGGQPDIVDAAICLGSSRWLDCDKEWTSWRANSAAGPNDGLRDQPRGGRKNFTHDSSVGAV
jgi:hypothetical protein